MGDKTKIEWADATWNPLKAKRLDGGKPGWHCVKVSPGCEGCYAESMNRVYGTGVPYRAQDRAKVYTYLDWNLVKQPLSWTRPRLIFPGSMTDIFADWVPGAWIDIILAVAALTPHHRYLFTTKRQHRMRRHINDPETVRRVHQLVHGIATALGLSAPTAETWPLPNVWLGVSIEDQKWAEIRVPELLETLAAVRWVSAEPLLGPIDLGTLQEGLPNNAWLTLLDGLDWVVAGGESGSRARPAHPDWFRSLRDQCHAAGVRFLFKQWGQYGPTDEPASVEISGATVVGMKRYKRKADAGRLLDGQEWNEFPEGWRAAA